ncbi:hypothetical protein HNP48_005580 [Acidovorax soli]|uniref:Uncharacterized protein n=1 Tax=Acidovorax soli TaxID=592050 RepID=A0A7X0PJ15_9BURK|nr:hypothetical protein [Acidovorax soli]
MGLYCFSFVAEGGGRVSARRPRYLFFASPKKSTQKKGDPAARVPLARGRGGSLRCSDLWCAAELAAFFELRSNSCGKLDNDARVLRHALTPGPALLGTVRRGGERAPHGCCFRSRAEGRLRAARCRRPTRSEANGAERSDGPCGAPNPFWTCREAQKLGWRVCRRTHALRHLTRRSCLTGAPSKRERREFFGAPQLRASQVAPERSAGDTDSRVAFSLVTFSWRDKRKLLRRRAHTPAPAFQPSKPSPPNPE